MNTAAEVTIKNKLTERQPILFDDAYAFITQAMPPLGIERHDPAKGLERSLEFFTRLGSPQEHFSSIHVAGTSGKGTVSSLLGELLYHHGKKVGVHTSPHVYDIRERCYINGRPITRALFADEFKRIVPTIFDMQTSTLGCPTYNEATLAIAYYAFQSHKVDYAVIETGLGGLYDSTNTISRSDKLAVITALGYDHTELLGNTLSDIARHKSGILPIDGDAIVLKPVDKGALESIRKSAQDRGTQVHFIEPKLPSVKLGNRGQIFTYTSPTLSIPDIHLPLFGSHQVQNAYIAIACLEFLAKRDGFKVNPRAVRSAFNLFKMPGRFEELELFDNHVILDGAHNEQKIAGLVDALKQAGYQKAVWVVALKNTKNAKEVMDIIKPCAKSVVTTSFFSTQEGLGSTEPLDTDELVGSAKAAGIKVINQSEDNIQALRLACTEAGGKIPVVVSGSFCLVRDIHERLRMHGLL